MPISWLSALLLSTKTTLYVLFKSNTSRYHFDHTATILSLAASLSKLSLHTLQKFSYASRMFGQHTVRGKNDIAPSRPTTALKKGRTMACTKQMGLHVSYMAARSNIPSQADHFIPLSNHKFSPDQYLDLAKL